MRLPDPDGTDGGGIQGLMTSARFLARTVDYLGLLLIGGFAILLLLPLQWGGSSYEWNSSVIIGMLCGAVVSLGVFIGWERYMGVRAMIPFHVIGQRVVYCSCIFFASLLASIVFRTFYLPIFFQSVQGDSALMSGVKMLPSIVAQISATMASGVLGMSVELLASVLARRRQEDSTDSYQWIDWGTTCPLRLRVLFSRA